MVLATLLEYPFATRDFGGWGSFAVVHNGPEDGEREHPSPGLRHRWTSGGSVWMASKKVHHKHPTLEATTGDVGVMTTGDRSRPCRCLPVGSTGSTGLGVVGVSLSGWVLEPTSTDPGAAVIVEDEAMALNFVFSTTCPLDEHLAQHSVEESSNELQMLSGSGLGLQYVNQPTQLEK